MLGSASRALLLVCGAVGCSANADFAGGGATLSGSSTPTHVVARPEPELASSGAGGESTSCAISAPILADQVGNARDLGGVPLSPAGHVACGVLFRGPPLLLNPTVCAEAAQLDLHTVIDLRIDAERESVPDATCVTARRVNAPLPVPYGLGPADYLADLHETASLAVVFHTLGDPSAYPSYFHCTYGRDRTGVVAALWLLTLGATRDTVMQEYLLSEPNVGAYPDSLAAVLDEIEARGGAEAVLKDAGITADEIAVMRQQRAD